MTPTLSLILPIRNAQHQLARQVQQLLELAPELTSRFEVLLIDDHSTDLTGEIASDISREFPQVRYMRQSGKGFAVGAKEAAAAATGEIIITLEPGLGMNSAELRRMWDVRVEARQVLKQASRPVTISDNLMERLGSWGHSVATGSKLPLGSRIDEAHEEATPSKAIPSFVSHLRNMIG